MKDNRSGEQGGIPARHDRFFKAGDYWYYNTREGVDIGPFDSLADAEDGANEFVDFINGADPAVLETLEQCGGREVA